MKISFLWHSFISSSLHLHAHEKGAHLSADGRWDYEKWIKWIGNFHPIALHFPIALIIMTVIAELLGMKSRSPIFIQAARFMIIAAAITALPTALLGLAYGYEVSYDETLSLIFWWHRFLGLSTAILAFVTVCFKELQLRKKIGVTAYAISLSLLAILVTATGYLGGEMTFGLFHLFP